VPLQPLVPFPQGKMHSRFFDLPTLLSARNLYFAKCIAHAVLSLGERRVRRELWLPWHRALLLGPWCGLTGLHACSCPLVRLIPVCEELLEYVDPYRSINPHTWAFYKPQRLWFIRDNVSAPLVICMLTQRLKNFSFCSEYNSDSETVRDTRFSSSCRETREASPVVFLFALRGNTSARPGRAKGGTGDLRRKAKSWASQKNLPLCKSEDAAKL